MPYDFAAAKAKLHRVVHDTLGVDALYLGDKDGATPVPLRVRWHNQLATTGDLNGDFSVSIDTIDRLIFDIPELTAKGVTIKRGARVQLTAPHFGGAVLEADTRDPKSDAAREIWHVGRYHGNLTS